MKFIFEIASDEDSNGVKEYAVIIRGQFPITKYGDACILQDKLLLLLNRYIRQDNRKASRASRKKIQVRTK